MGEEVAPMDVDDGEGDDKSKASNKNKATREDVDISVEGEVVQTLTAARGPESQIFPAASDDPTTLNQPLTETAELEKLRQELEEQMSQWQVWKNNYFYILPFSITSSPSIFYIKVSKGPPLLTMM